jgi:hypothetical protein
VSEPYKEVNEFFAKAITEENLKLREMLKEIIFQLNQWQEAYPIEVFPDPPRVLEKSIVTQEHFAILKTQCAAAMGRHIIKCWQNDFGGRIKSLLGEP